MRRLPAFLFALLLPGTAFAYKHLGDPPNGGQYLMWAPDQMPITWYSSSILDDSLPQTPDGATGLYYQELVMIKSFCNWKWTDYCDEIFSGRVDFLKYEDATCSALEFEYLGLTSDSSGASNDGIRKVFFEDPGEEIGATVNGVTYSWGSNTIVKEQNGNTYYAFNDSDIVFNQDRDWGPTDEVELSCNGSVFAIEATATHEVGHSLGMGHSCDDGEVCRDSELLNATMFWQGGPCDTSRNSINEDDISGMQALYGPFATFSTDSTRFGGVPLTVDFKIETDDEITSAEWHFGDGETSTDLEPSHTYQSEGQFSVTVEFTGTSDLCGGWDYQYRELAYVLSCQAPTPVFSFDVVAEEGDGLIYQMVNQTPVTTYGCIDEITWEVYKGDELIESFSAWAPKIEFPDLGDYRVVLQVAGPGGGGAAELDVPVDGKVGCSSAPSRANLGMAALALGLLAALRRRK